MNSILLVNPIDQEGARPGAGRSNENYVDPDNLKDSVRIRKISDEIRAKMAFTRQVRQRNRFE